MKMSLFMPWVRGQMEYMGRVLVERWTKREYSGKANIDRPGYKPMVELQQLRLEGDSFCKLCMIAEKLKFHS